MNGVTRRGLIAGAGALAAGGALAQAPRPLRVVTTTAMLADGVRAITGARGVVPGAAPGAARPVQVSSLMGEGVDPHLYKPTRADIARLVGADLVMAHGLQLEAQFRETFEQIARSKPVVYAGEQIPRERLLADEEFKDKPDPHVWMDPDLWAVAMAGVRDALIAADPPARDAYGQGYEAYAARLAELQAYARRILASVPAERRVLVTAHDAFRYFARAYAYEVEGIQGVSTESEAGLKQIEAVVERVVAAGIPAIFVEASVSDRNVKAVMEGASRRGHAVRVGAQLFSDSMGRADAYEGTYLGMIDHNVTTIARALGGEAPERGFQGRLGSGA